MIELPFPDKILWPNGRGHWAVKSKAFKAHKGWAYIAGKSEFRFRASPPELVDWSVTIHPKTANVIDDDNARASLKAYQDGFAAALGVDDSAFNAPTLTFGKPVKGGLVVVTFA